MGLEWKLRSASAFLTEKARSRAPQIVDYAAATGGALLVSPRGEIALSGGAVGDVDVARIVRTASALGAADEMKSFTAGATCVHAAPVRGGWILCVLSPTGVPPALVIERANKAARVLALALVDGGRPGSSGGSSGPSGAPAEARVARPSRKN